MLIAHFFSLTHIKDDASVVGPMIGELSDDDGYVSPEFDLPSDDEEEDDTMLPPPKRSKPWSGLKSRRAVENTIEDEEELALQLLRRR